MQQRRAVSRTAALAVAVVASTMTWMAPAQAAPAPRPIAAAVAPMAAVPTANPCGTTGTDMNGTGCRYATVGTDMFRAPYYQPNVTFTVYGARSRPGVAATRAWGGMSKGTLKLTPGASYQVNVGGPARGDTQQLGGFNGGGNSGRTSVESGSTITGARGGGGASDVREGSYSLNDRLFVAGGGGGFAGVNADQNIQGGEGGGANGIDGDSGIGSSSGGGGSQTQAGRSPGNAGSAGFGFGGSGGSGPIALSRPGAGGGGGYYGGGGTGVVFGGVIPSAGGGGSGYITPRATDTASKTGGQVDAYTPAETREELVGERDGRGLVTATWPGGPVSANVTVTASPSGPVDPDTIVTLTTKVTTSTGVTPVGQIRFVDYTEANGSTDPKAPGACPCSNLTGDIIDSTQDGTYVKRVRAGSLPYGPDHAVVAIFDDLYGEIPLTTSAPATYSVNGPTPEGVDLGLSLTGTPDPATVGSDVTYTLGVTNYSTTATATSVKPDLFLRNVNGDEVSLKLADSSASCRNPLDGATAVTCDFGDVAPGETETATVVATVKKVGEQVASANIPRAAQTDPNPDNDSVEITTDVEADDPPPPADPSADLSIGMQAPEQVDDGESFVYEIGTYNAGPDTAQGVTVTDELPAGVTFDAASSSPECTDDAGTVTCALGDYGPGRIVNTRIGVTADGVGTLSNTATIDGDLDDPSPSTNSATAATEVRTPPAATDLSIVKTAPDRVEYRADLVYTIAVTNNGPNDATGVTATDALPADTRFKSAGTSSSCQPDFQQRVVTCDFGTVADGATESAEIVVIPDAVRRISNTATVDGDEPDSDTSNDSSTASTLVQDPNSPADLSITKSAGVVQAEVGDDITYELEVTNESASNTSASRVVAIDDLPEGVTFKSAGTSSECTHASGTVTCDLGQIFGQASKTVQVVVTTTQSGSVSNTATVEGAGVDPDLTNDASTAVVQVAAAPEPGALGFATADVEVDEGGTATVTVERSGGSDGSVAVDYATSDGTAESGDYTSTSGTLTFADGDTTKTFTVTTTEDTTVESDETIGLTLSGPTGGATLGDADATVTILDDDEEPDPPVEPGTVGFVVEDVDVDEGGTATVTVDRAGGTDGSVTVDYATSDGTADSDDYTSASGTLTFADGDTTKTFTVETTQDTVVEADETVDLDLSNPTGGATIGDADATLTITDDDEEEEPEPPAEPGTLGFSAQDYPVQEGEAATVTVTRTGGSDGSVSLTYATGDPTARAAGPAGSDDFTPTTGTLTFADGVTSRTFTVQTTDDDVDEPDETITLSLADAAGGATLGDAAATITITDDDEATDPGDGGGGIDPGDGDGTDPGDVDAGGSGGAVSGDGASSGPGTADRGGSSGLPDTGGTDAHLLTLGALLLAAGGVLLLRRRQQDG